MECNIKQSSRLTIFKEVPEDWYSNYKIKDDGRYQGKYVSISLLQLNVKETPWRVCIWGNDDFGMEKDFKDLNQAQQQFEWCIYIQPLTKQYLQMCGFSFA